MFSRGSVGDSVARRLSVDSSKMGLDRLWPLDRFVVSALPLHGEDRVVDTMGLLSS